jgi:hypothetical protein
MAPWAVSAIRGAPAAFVRATYQVARKQGKALGEIKAMFHAASRHAVLCLHDEIGYEKTFTRVATEFADGIVHAGLAPEAPQLSEVYQLAVNTVPVGFSRNHTVKVQGKLTRASVAFIIFPAGDSDLRFADYIEMQEVDAAGGIKSGVWATAMNGQVELQLQLDQVKGGEYKYAGQAKGEPVSGTFTTKDKAALPGYPMNAKRLAPHARTAKAFSISTFEYTPNEDVTAPTSVRFHREAGDATGSVRVSKPNQERTGTLDAQGLVQWLRVPVGQATMEMNRVFVDGRL